MSSNSSKDTEHHLIHLANPPPSLVALRKELAFHPDIVEYAQRGRDFEECLGRIGARLGIILDGDYDCEKLCSVLVDALRARKSILRVPKLIH